MSKKLVCAAVIRKEGMTLVCSRPKASILRDKMEFPGGKVEPGESIHECIVRELREELNAEILPLDVIGEVEHEYPAGILDIVFIVPFGMGVGGAALATVLSQLLAAILSAVSALRHYPVLRIERMYWRADRQSIMQNLHVGFIMGFQMSVMCIGQLVMQASVNKLGTYAIAGYTAATKVDQLSSLVNHSFLTAVSAYTAQNYGAGKVDRISRGIWSSLLIAEVADFIMIGIILLVQPFVVPMFVSDASPEVFAYASDFFLITLPFYPLLGVLCVYRTAVQSMGNSWAPFTACIIELVARCSASIIFGAIFGYRGVVFSTPFAWIGADLLVIPVYAFMIRKLKKTAIVARI